MAMWVFGYGSLIWKAGFPYDERLVGFIKDYRRVFYQGSTDHRGTPEFPGRTVTLEPAKAHVCWGAAYKINKKEDQLTALEVLSSVFTLCINSCSESINLKLDFCYFMMAPVTCPMQLKFGHMTHLEVREKQYDEKVFLNFFTESSSSIPAVSNVMVYIGSADKKRNENYLGPAPLEEIASQISRAEGPSGPNTEYLFKLESALTQIGCEDKHVTDLANEVRRIILKRQLVA